MEFAQVDQLDIVAGSRKLKLKGVNLGNWMLIEHFMIGLPWVEHKMREIIHKRLGTEKYHAFFDTYMDAFITEADIEYLHSLGMNVLRLPFNYRHFEKDDKPFDFSEKGFDCIDRLIGWCRKRDMYILLDLHAAPGCQARDWNAESRYGESFFWEIPWLRERCVALWQTIARRYRDEPAILGYEILNEPLAYNDTVFHDFNMRALAAIRREDPRHIVVVEADEWGRNMATLKEELFKDPQVIPSLHHYHSQYPPFVQLGEYPGMFDGKQWGQKELVACLAGKYDFDRIRRPVFVGEFGVHVKYPHRKAMLAMLDDLLSFFDQQPFHWTLWSYKDNNQMGLTGPKESTPWRLFYQSDAYRGVRDRYTAVKKEFMQQTATALPEFSAEAQAHLFRQLDHNWHEILLDYVCDLMKPMDTAHLRECARSFSFEQCAPMEDTLAVLKKHL